MMNYLSNTIKVACGTESGIQIASPKIIILDTLVSSADS